MNYCKNILMQNLAPKFCHNPPTSSLLHTEKYVWYFFTSQQTNQITVNTVAKNRLFIELHNCFQFPCRIFTPHVSLNLSPFDCVRLTYIKASPQSKMFLLFWLTLTSVPSLLGSLHTSGAICLCTSLEILKGDGEQMVKTTKEVKFIIISQRYNT